MVTIVEQHPLAGKRVKLKLLSPDPSGKIKDGDILRVEDWFHSHRVGGATWREMLDQNPACQHLLERIEKSNSLELEVMPQLFVMGHHFETGEDFIVHTNELGDEATAEELHPNDPLTGA